MRHIFFAFILVISGCSLLSPKASIEINLVGEKTSLENQVIGNYSFLGNDELLLVSVRTLPDDISKISDGKKRAFLAYQNRQYNMDDYRRFMDMGVIGETLNADISVRDMGMMESDKELARFVNRFIYEENRDRVIIFGRILDITEGLDSGDLPKVREIFSKKFRDEAESGWYVQDEYGEWTIKE